MLKHRVITVLLLSLFSSSLHASQSSRGENWRNYVDPEAPIYQHNFSESQTVSPGIQSQYKIVSYNIKYSRQLEKIAEHLSSQEKLKNADIILLQEVVGVPGDKEQHAAHYLARRLKYNYVYAPASRRELE